MDARILVRAVSLRAERTCSLSRKGSRVLGGCRASSSHPPASPVPTDLPQQVSVWEPQGSHPQQITRCRVALHTRMCAHMAPETHAHIHADRCRAGRLARSPQTATSLFSLSRLREKLCCTIQIYFNTQHWVEQDFYILLLMNKVNCETHVFYIGCCSCQLCITAWLAM